MNRAARSYFVETNAIFIVGQTILCTIGNKIIYSCLKQIDGRTGSRSNRIVAVLAFRTLQQNRFANRGFGNGSRYLSIVIIC